MPNRTWSQFGSTPKYSYVTDVFECIDNEEKAYWLGFLYADGWVSTKIDKFCLSLSVKDREHLIKYRNFICPDRELDECPKQNSARLIVSSKKITKDLVNLGCIPQKTLNLLPPTKVPNELLRHFIRGYFDGDGCARLVKNNSRVSISILSTRELLNYFRDTFRSIGATCRGKIENPKQYNAFRFSNECRADLQIIYRYFYTSSSIFLERKKEIFSKCLQEG